MTIGLPSYFLDLQKQRSSGEGVLSGAIVGVDGDVSGGEVARPHRICAAAASNIEVDENISLGKDRGRIPLLITCGHPIGKDGQ